MISFPVAKINLGLSVIERRLDGMHNLKTCMIPIPLFDVLEIRRSKRFSLVTHGLSIGVPQSENIITRTWEYIISLKKNIKPVEVALYKNIPVGSGLGGGSSDAAYFIKLINDFYSLGFSKKMMKQIANEIGADCPFFIDSETVIATGTGEITTPIYNPVSKKYVTIVFPGFNCSTSDLFSCIIPKPSTIDYSLLNKGVACWKETIINDFEEIVFEKFPKLIVIKKKLYESGADFVSLTGSGSGIFALSAAPLHIDVDINKYSVWSLFID